VRTRTQGVRLDRSRRRSCGDGLVPHRTTWTRASAGTLGTAAEFLRRMSDSGIGVSELTPVDPLAEIAVAACSTTTS
jgi:hypothetical protein